VTGQFGLTSIGPNGDAGSPQWRERERQAFASYRRDQMPSSRRVTIVADSMESRLRFTLAMTLAPIHS
jgi:hypothetical protein